MVAVVRQTAGRAATLASWARLRFRSGIHWVAALGTAARVKAAPAVDAVAVALKALVHLARGQLEAHWAHQGRRQIECPISAIGDTKASATETRYSGRSFSQMSIPQKIKSGTSSNGCR